MKLSVNNQLVLTTRTYSNRGFTLVELLVVIAIIATLSAIGFGTFLKIQGNARANETRVIISAIATAMESRASNITSSQRLSVGVGNGDTYHNGDGSEASTTPLINYISGDFDGDGVIDNGVTTELPQVVIESADSSSFISQVGSDWVIVDAWGTPLRYTFPGNHNNHDDGFDLESAGPDEDFEQEDDNIILE